MNCTFSYKSLLSGIFFNSYPIKAHCVQILDKMIANCVWVGRGSDYDWPTNHPTNICVHATWKDILLRNIFYWIIFEETRPDTRLMLRKKTRLAPRYNGCLGISVTHGSVIAVLNCNFGQFHVIQITASPTFGWTYVLPYLKSLIDGQQNE